MMSYTKYIIKTYSYAVQMNLIISSISSVVNDSRLRSNSRRPSLILSDSIKKSAMASLEMSNEFRTNA
jgi:hypothetical protein